MKLNKKKITAIVVGILLATAIIVIKNKKRELSEIPVMKKYAVVVATFKAKEQNETLHVPYLATVMSDSSVTVSSRTPARIVKILASGTPVKKGDVVARLDDRDLQDKKYTVKLETDSARTELSAKQIALANAKATHRRTLKLLRVKGASIEMSQKEETAIKGLEAAVQALGNKIKILNANLSQIETALSYTTLRAPIEGQVAKTFANAGEMAMPGKPLLRIENENGKYLLIRTADRHHAQACLFEGKKYAMQALESTFNGLLEYRADVRTQRSNGESVPVSLITYDKKGTRVPINALLQKDAKNYCFVIQHQKARPVEVQIVARGEESVIVKGLADGDEVVIAKPDILLQLLAGRPVTVKNR